MKKKKRKTRKRNKRGGDGNEPHFIVFSTKPFLKKTISTRIEYVPERIKTTRGRPDHHPPPPR